MLGTFLNSAFTQTTDWELRGAPVCRLTGQTLSSGELKKLNPCQGILDKLPKRAFPSIVQPIPSRDPGRPTG